MKHTRQHDNPALTAALTPNLILVESLGMQHWLNMALAEGQGIAMNLQFPMPTRFMWQIARQVLGSELIPEQSSYKREVLTWRIYDLIHNDEVIKHTDNNPIQRYFERLGSTQLRDERNLLETAELGVNEAKKLQFCRSLADVYEQYMLYRPDWLQAWETGKTVSEHHLGMSQHDEAWQANLWRHLVAQQSYHPASLHRLTVDALAADDRGLSSLLPQHIYIFALNTMAPQLVSFLNALAQHCEIHLFHLNPCVNYWGDAQSQKQQLRQRVTQSASSISQQLEHWLSDKSDNPLLSNLGQQGRDLFNLLQQQPSFEVSAFEAPRLSVESIQEGSQPTLLTQVKQAIFEGRNRPEEGLQTYCDDSSVVVVKAHSALRELQGLHDFLLDCLSKDETLQPRDILIMCPAIENYAAFIPAIFNSGHQEDNLQRIPCSIADRAPLDSMPEVSAFLTLLDITQSRFEVSTVVDYLRLPAIQKRFTIAEQELDVIVHWISHANIHWGLNAAHKSHFLNNYQQSDLNTWEWGLNRLLIGFAQIDSPVFQGELLTLPDAEGQKAELLGKLCALLEQLQWHLQQLKQPRDAAQWQQYLLQLRQRLFSEDENSERALATIDRGIADLVKQCDLAGYNGKISIFVLQDALNHSFTKPDAINHFMTGQVTFCSMLPMRSIPFKVIAMLGLNDGEFPRVSTPFSIDLMQSTSRRLGDRSRRGDDRYLFLESVISARQQLYLSYQANSIKDNSERQPSLVLREFCDYLQQSFGNKAESNSTPFKAYTLPLHAFHPSHFEDYTSAIPSYDNGWLRLAEGIISPQQAQQKHLDYRIDPIDIAELSVSELTKALTDPLKYFANHSLGLYLDSREPELLDTEPFSIDGLSRYNILSEATAQHQQATAMDFDESIAFFSADGAIPTDCVSAAVYDSWRSVTVELQQQIDSYTLENTLLSASIGSIDINAQMQLTRSNECSEDDEVLIVDYRPATMRSEHHLKMRLNQLVASIALSRPIAGKLFSLEQTNGELRCHSYDYPGYEPDIAAGLLDKLYKLYRTILTRPQLLHCGLGQIVTDNHQPLTDTESEDDAIILNTKLIAAWDNELNSEYASHSSLINDYYRWFFTVNPRLDKNLYKVLLDCYQPLLSGYKKNASKSRKKVTN